MTLWLLSGMSAYVIFREHHGRGQIRMSRVELT